MNERQKASEKADILTAPSRKLPKWERPKWPKKGQVQKDVIHQADLLFMPVDKVKDVPYRYILVVVDIGTRLIAARPLAVKFSDKIAEAFRDIYSKSDLKWPVALQVDSGSEFMKDVSTLMKQHNVKIRRARPNRHSQQAIVEGNNRVIAKYLFHDMVADEIRTKQKSTKWVNRLPKYVKIINSNRLKVKDSPQNDKWVPKENIMIYPEGTMVRYLLDRPVDYITRKPTDDKFRTGDIKWSDPVEIVNILLYPDQPPRYMVKGLKDVSFTRNQIKVL